MVSKGTHVIIPMVDQLEDECWEAKIVEQDGTTVKLSVNSPATAVCGLYGLAVTCGSTKSESTTTHNSSKNIVMLFNPWCEGKIGSGLWASGGGQRVYIDPRQECGGGDKWWTIKGAKWKGKRQAALRNMSGAIYILMVRLLALRPNASSEKSTFSSEQSCQLQPDFQGECSKNTAAVLCMASSLW